jgi:antitoxin VapB
LHPPKRRYILLIYSNGFLMETAKIFWTGRSQAVRLPKEFRFAEETVRIRRHGSSVILEPIAEDWRWLDALSGNLDGDFLDSARAKPAEQQRPDLDRLFE